MRRGLSAASGSSSPSVVRGRLPRTSRRRPFKTSATALATPRTPPASCEPAYRSAIWLSSASITASRSRSSSVSPTADPSRPDANGSHNGQGGSAAMSVAARGPASVRVGDVHVNEAGGSPMRLPHPSPALVIACLALLLAAGGVSYATVKGGGTGTPVNILDPSNGTLAAKVDSSGALKTNANVTGGKVALAAPAQPWRASQEFGGGSLPQGFVAGPFAGTINITSISISLAAGSAATDTANVSLAGWRAPGGAADCSYSSDLPDGILWQIPEITGATPLVVTFPTPLQYRPPAGSKACLSIALLPGSTPASANLSGFYG